MWPKIHIIVECNLGNLLGLAILTAPGSFPSILGSILPIAGPSPLGGAGSGGVAVPAAGGQRGRAPGTEEGEYQKNEKRMSSL